MGEDPGMGRSAGDAFAGGLGIDPGAATDR